MRLWIAVFLITLFAFQALPVRAMGTACVQLEAGPAGGADGEDEADTPESGKLKKNSPALDDCYLNPTTQRPCMIAGADFRPDYAPAIVRPAATGHVKLDTPPPDRH